MVCETRRRGKEKFKTNLKQIGCEDVDWIYLAHDIVQWLALVNMESNFWVS
jgi:hypothetical protein